MATANIKAAALSTCKLPPGVRTVCGCPPNRHGFPLRFLVLLLSPVISQSMMIISATLRSSIVPPVNEGELSKLIFKDNHS
jgi:hypothetical protein